MSKEIDLGKLAFYWRMTEKPNVPKNPVPDFVDFKFGFWEEYQLIIQTRNQQTWDYLDIIYKENYNVGYLQEGHDLAESYGNDFLKFIDESIKQYGAHVKKISEVGAGGCYILKKLKQSGFEVAAIDPSPIAMEKGKEFGIEVVPAFYPAEGGVPKSDMIIHYDVLEHVPDPVAFLKHHVNDLNDGGFALFAVPDCSHYIEKGDVSMIIHEHLNFYDHESLSNVVSAAGFEVLVVRRAEHGGVLYCLARKGNKTQWQAKTGTEKFDRFSANLELLRTRVSTFIKEGTASGNSFGCYIPLRTIPYLSMLGIQSGIRFFDDDKGIYKKYFDGFEVPIENFEDLKNKPLTHLMIMSAAFGEKLKEKIKQQIPGGEKMVIRTFKDFSA